MTTGIPTMLPFTNAAAGDSGFGVVPPKMEGNQLVTGGGFFAQYIAAGHNLNGNAHPALSKNGVELGQLLAEGGKGLPQVFQDMLAQLQSGELGPVTAAPELEALAQEFQQLLQAGDEEAIVGFLQQYQLYLSPSAELKQLSDVPPSSVSAIAQALRGGQGQAAQTHNSSAEALADEAAVAAQQRSVAQDGAMKPVIQDPNEYVARPKVLELTDNKEGDVIRQVKMGAMMSQLGQGQTNADAGGRQPGSGEQQQAWLSATAALGLGTRPAAATHAAAPVMTSIPVPVQDPGWSNALANRVTWMAKDKVQSAEIRLNPERLGPIEVRVELNDDQARVTISSQHAAVRDVIDSAMPRLREMLNAQGFNLADAQVTDQSLNEQRQRQAQEGESEGQGADGGLHEGEGLMSEGALGQEDELLSAIDFYA